MKYLLAAVASLTFAVSSASHPENVECVVYEYVDGTDRGRSWRARCDADRTTYSLEGLPAIFFETAVSGETVFKTSATKSKASENRQNTLHVTHGSAISTYKRNNKGNMPGRKLRHQTRELYKVEGISSVLVVRVTDSTGMSPNKNKAALYSDIFTDLSNMKSQYSACSGGKLNFEPASGSGISDGVYEVTISYAVHGVHRYTVEDYVEAQLKADNVAESSYDHVMYVLPEGVDFQTAAAYAQVGGSRAVYKNNNVATLLVQMHETGHNLNLRHSGFNGVRYDDKSCFMGAHLYLDDGPYMCFNGPKSWALGWYSEGHVTASPGNWQGKLVGVDDIVKANGFDEAVHTSILKLPTQSSGYDDFYLMYNQAKGVNAGVVQHGDKVTIVSTSCLSCESTLLASLDETHGAHNIANWDGTNDLVVQVCERASGAPDYARVIVYLNDGNNDLTCSTTSSSPPSDSPTKAPVVVLCTAATVDDSSCFRDSDCCSNSCSKGNVNQRVCLAGSGVGGGETGSCPSDKEDQLYVPGTCSKDSDCCSNSCSKGNPNDRYCIE